MTETGVEKGALENRWSQLMKTEYLLVALISGIGFVFYLWILTRHPLIYGIDGPYYLIQVRGLLESGRLQYGDPPLAFLLFTFFTLLVGGDMTLGVRVGTALFSALSTVPLYSLLKRVTKLEYAGYVGMLACIFSAPHIRMMNDLLKNAVGVCFLLFFVYHLHRMAFSGRARRDLLLASLFLVLTGATHILDLGVALLFLGLYLIIAVALDVNRRQFAKGVGAVVLVMGAFVGIAFGTFPSLFTDFYKGVYFLQDLFATSGQEPSGPLPPGQVPIGQVPPDQGPPVRFLFDPRGGVLTLPILACGTVLAVYEWKMGKREAVLMLSSVTVVGILLSLPFIPHEWLWRFLLMEFIPIAFILGYSVSKIEQKVGVVVFAMLVVFPLLFQSVEASRLMGPTIDEGGLRELELIGSIVPSDSVVASIVHPRSGYWVQYVLGGNVTRGLSSRVWLHHQHVFGLLQRSSFSRPLPPYRVVIEGKEFILVEFQRPPP